MKLNTVWTFIDRTDKVLKAKAKAAGRWLYRVGGLIRTISRRSLKRARPVRSEEELSDEQLDRWLIINRSRERRGLEWLDLPDRTSKPGQPPLLHMDPSPLKAMLNFKVDRDREDVVIGPERARSGTVHRLEHGDAELKPRPFMAPSMDKAEKQAVRWWEDAIARA